MVKIIEGDLLDSAAEFICHQVNCQGVMGSGVAKQIRDRYPRVYELYKIACDRRSKQKRKQLLGSAQFISVGEGTSQKVVNLFAQENYGYDGALYTNYRAFQKCLDQLAIQGVGKTLAFPYNIGCDRGGGDWSVIFEMIKNTLVNSNVEIWKLN